MRRILKIVFVLVALYAAYRFTLYCMVEAKLNEIRKQGYPVTLAELDKWYPQVPAGENAAELYVEVFKRLPKKIESDTNLPELGYAKSPPRSAPLSSEMQNSVMSCLATQRESLNLLHEAATKRACRYPFQMLDTKERYESQMKIFSPVGQGMRLLYLEALLASAAGDSQRATEAVISSIALGRSLGDRSSLIHYLIMIGRLGIAVSSLEQALNRTTFTEQQLVQLSIAFKKVESGDAFARAMIGERALANEQWKEIRDGNVAVKDLIAHEEHTAMKYDHEIATIYRPSGLLDLDYLGYLDFLAGLIESSRVTFPARFAQIDSLTRKTRERRLYPLARMEAYWLGYVVRRDAQDEARARVVCAALAVERYRLANGSVPDSLSMLAPQFIDAAPTDPFDGQPLRFKKLAKGYVVYSVGEDGKDDGGDETVSARTKWKSADITFRVER